MSPRWWIPERRGTGLRWAVLLRWERCPFSIGDGPPPREKVHSIANSSIAESPCSADELTCRREDLRTDVAEVAGFVVDGACAVGPLSYGPGFLDLPEIRGHEKSDLDLPALESQFGTQCRRSRSSASHLAPEPTAAAQQL